MNKAQKLAEIMLKTHVTDGLIDVDQQQLRRQDKELSKRKKLHRVSSDQWLQSYTQDELVKRGIPLFISGFGDPNGRYKGFLGQSYIDYNSGSIWSSKGGKL